ncbi:unannotated protein [freshwater metagenome]|uniref:Unannotated protein n=1 Tax=freshwater metagenome TaxID=449393 RepID=A0A6J6C373_9ZZZZ
MSFSRFGPRRSSAQITISVVAADAGEVMKTPLATATAVMTLARPFRFFIYFLQGVK